MRPDLRPNTARPLLLPVCAFCGTRDDMRIESWARFERCTRPTCIYLRADLVARQMREALQAKARN